MMVGGRLTRCGRSQIWNFAGMNRAGKKLTKLGTPRHVMACHGMSCGVSGHVVWHVAGGSHDVPRGLAAFHGTSDGML